MATRSHWALATSLLILSFSLATGAAQAQQVDDPTQYTYEQLKQNIVLGKTTKEELRAKYGEPDSINRASAKEGGYERSWTYYPSESHGEKIRGRVTGFLRGLVPGKARTAGDVAQEHGVGARNVKDFALYIDLNKDGVVEDFDLTEWNNSQRSF